MTVLVTGGAGFIGSHSVERLLETGWNVRVLDNFSSGARKNLPTHDALEIVEGDIRDFDAVRLALEGVSHVLHLAAQVFVQASLENPPNSCSINVLGFVNVLQAARTSDVQRVVYASSAAVYGPPQPLPIDETHACQPMSPYGLEKSINDQYGKLFEQEFFLPLLGLRYFNVYGPRQDPRSPYAGVISKFISQLKQQQSVTIFGDGTQTRDFIFVKDIARANVAALQSPLTGVCNVATGKSCSLLQMVQTLAKCTGQPLEVVHQAARHGDIHFSSSNNDRLGQVLNTQDFTSLERGLSLLVQETEESCE